MLRMTRELGAEFARLALGHVTREYPNKLDHVIGSASDVRSPRALHPVFYGSFDWHSSVHGHWLLAHLYRRFPDLPEAGRLREVMDQHFTHDGVSAELGYLRDPLHTTFERPYGWAWLLMLAGELRLHSTPEGQRWHATLSPLADAFATRFLEHLPRATYPIRAGTHYNTAFALALAHEYALIEKDAPLARCVAEKASDFFARDRDCQAWEPGGDDFLSPALVEVECMRRILAAGPFTDWLDRFLPRLATGEPATLFEPATVSDRSDGKIRHLDGLNLSRAWCWRGLAATLPHDDERHPVALAAAEKHLAASLDHVGGDYMGEHWLATFALLALTDTTSTQ